MVIDSSALIAILLQEAEAMIFANLLGEARYRLVSTLSFLEASIVISSRFSASGVEQLDRLIADNDLALVPFTKDQAVIARQAYLNYGKGHHPAKLNMGDCCSYALAKIADQPLLFKGNDFSQTDIEQVIY